MVSFISFVLPIYHKAATGFLFLSSLFSNQDHTNKQLQSCIGIWPTGLLYKIPLILYCEHIQHSTKEMSSSYFMSLPKSRPSLIIKKKKIAWQYLNNSLTVPGENSKWGVILFLSKVELTSLLTLVPYFLKKIYFYPFHYGLFQKKSKQKGWGYTFLKNPWNFSYFFTLPLEIWKFQTKQSSTPGHPAKLC